MSKSIKTTITVDEKVLKNSKCGDQNRCALAKATINTGEFKVVVVPGDVVVARTKTGATLIAKLSKRLQQFVSDFDASRWSKGQRITEGERFNVKRGEYTTTTKVLKPFTAMLTFKPMDEFQTEEYGDYLS